MKYRCHDELLDCRSRRIRTQWYVLARHRTESSIKSTDDDMTSNRLEKTRNLNTNPVSAEASNRYPSTEPHIAACLFSNNRRGFFVGCPVNITLFRRSCNHLNPQGDLYDCASGQMPILALKVPCEAPLCHLLHLLCILNETPWDSIWFQCCGIQEDVTMTSSDGRNKRKRGQGSRGVRKELVVHLKQPGWSALQ